MELFQGWESFVTVKIGEIVTSQVQFLQFRHVLEWCKSFEFIINSLKDLEIGVALPTLVHFLKLIEGDIQVLKLWALESCEIAEFIAAQV